VRSGPSALVLPVLPEDDHGYGVAMIRVFIVLLVVVALVASLLHVSAGWAWIIVLAAIGGVALYKAKTPGSSQYVKLSAAWKCPFCLKRSKLGATACHHCGRSLMKPPERLQ